MCTVTIIPQGPVGFRMLCNRDEQRTRPPAQSPQHVKLDEFDAVMPIDPVGGGTWIAATDHGLVMTLLNMNLKLASPSLTGASAKESRGWIITELIKSANFERACEGARRIDGGRFNPFRLVIANCEQLAVATCDGAEVHVERRAMPGRPWMITSSGLGDELVEGPRRELFDGWFGDERAAWGERQRAFHRHAWPEKPELSVCMSRPDARTVSVTSVTVSPKHIEMVYHPDAPDAEAHDETITLDCVGGAVG